MELRKIKGLVRLFEASDLAEVEVTSGGCVVRVSREGSHALQARCQPMSELRPGGSQLPHVETAMASPASSANPTRGHIVRSPMVGTSYLSASPDQPPFVTVGSIVKRGDTLGVLATLSTANRIHAPRSGTVIEVLVTSGQPVEFDQPLLVIG
jgi:acetyl-CoA carboxylase biotin carboxyl carrier protein